MNLRNILCIHRVQNIKNNLDGMNKSTSRLGPIYKSHHNHGADINFYQPSFKGIKIIKG